MLYIYTPILPQIIARNLVTIAESQVVPDRPDFLHFLRPDPRYFDDAEPSP